MTEALGAAASPLDITRRRDRRTNVDSVVTGLCTLATAGVVIVLGAIILFVLVAGLAGLTVQFLTRETEGYNAGGGLAAILGSLQMVPLALLIAAPLGILGGIYLAEASDGRVANAARFATETIAGLPSVLVGIFVFTILVAPFGQYSGGAGAVALAIIMLPIIARSVEEILRLVPPSVREAALALGIPWWRTVTSVILRTAAAGILTVVMLAVARAAGETAPLLLTTVGGDAVNIGDFQQPMDSLPAFIWFNSGQPDDTLNAQAWAASLVLLVFVLVVNLIVRSRSIGQRAA